MTSIIRIGTSIACNAARCGFDSSTLYFGHASGGEVVESIFTGSDARFVYLELTQRF